MPLNSTHILLSGGFEIDVLDLVNLVWTPSTPMSAPRNGHGCVLTEDGEVLVAGGFGGESTGLLGMA